MLILFDKISSKLLYLIEINGSLRDLNGMPFKIIGDGILKDINGKTYYIDKNKISPTNTNIYGVEWDINDATTSLTRVGNLSLHNATTGLPVQNKMKRCLLLDNGTVNYYLNPNNSNQKLDGSPSVLDGTDGQVMVEIPEHYRKFEFEGTKERVLISENPFDGAHLVPLQYMSAFEAINLTGNVLGSIVNVLPSVSISRIDFTTYAANRGPKWFQMLYETYKTMVWLYMIEYAQRNSQADFNSSLTIEGYRQGGLGAGVTNNSSLIRQVVSGLGSMDDFTSSTPRTVIGINTQVPQYRGIEHPFGHIWKWAEGINVRALPTSIEMYTANDYTFSSVNYSGYTLQGNLAIVNDFIKNLLTGTASTQIEIMPTVVGSGASATTYWSDQYFQSRPGSGESLRAVDFGGGASRGVNAGLLHSNVASVPSNTGTGIGARLCFVPSA
jgi:hypothetical protein